PAPSGLLYPQTSISAIVGTAIVTDVPTVTGSVASYSISPALPAGLALSSSTGVISGKPTAASAKTSYTVTASNSTGSTKAAVSIAVLIPAPSNLAYPEMSISATVGTAIATDTPTVTGTVSSYTISPALPAGLAISSSTGAISGKPTAATAEASYTVTASNSSGHTTTAVSIAVLIPAPSNLVYPQTSILAAVGAAIATDTPTVTGAVSSYTILPALPPGLAIVPSTGVISGTPTAASPKTTYTVKASNSTGSTTAQVTITVASATSILELGHGGGIMSIRATADSVLSIDWTGHWNLWSYSSGKELSSGDSGTEYVEGSSPNSTDNIGLAGDLAVAPLPSGLGVYSASTGQQIFVVPSGSAGIAWFSLATDGSYLCTGSSSGLTVWSPSGSQEFTRPGNYQSAEAFAAPGQVQVALGPAGAGVIETDSVPTGTSTTSASFSGTFNSWFVDGQRFLTNLGDTVWVYSAARVQQSIMSLPGIQNLTGQGDWIWSTTAGASLSVYAIGNATPVATYTLGGTTTDLPVATGSTLAILHVQMPAVTVIDLSGATPSATNYNLPAPLSVLSAFGAYSSSQWVVGNQNGVLLDGATASSATPRYFDYGAVFSIAGSSNNIAIATAIGEILLFDPTGATQQGAIDFLSGQLELSSDGSVLAAGAYAGFSQYLPDRTLNIYSLPSQAITQTFPYTFNLSGTPVLGDFSLSASGQTLGQVLESDDGSWPLSYSREVTPTSGSPITWSDTGIDGSLVLSPDGTNLAAANEYTPTPTATPSTANLWTNGALVTAIVAQPEGWIDNSHLLAANYTATNINSSIFVAYAGSTIYDPAGDVVATVPGTSFPAMPNPDFTSNGLVYDWVSNAVYSLATGAPVWNGPANKIVNTETAPIPLGALTGSNVVYVYGHQVFIAPY
ncbi:MAG: Ig domain-containing protein, partial [Terracidiphilus sp.]